METANPSEDTSSPLSEQLGSELDGGDRDADLEASAGPAVSFNERQGPDEPPFEATPPASAFEEPEAGAMGDRDITANGTTANAMGRRQLQAVSRGVEELRRAPQSVFAAARPLNHRTTVKQVPGPEREYSTLPDLGAKIKAIEHGLIHRHALARWLDKAWTVFMPDPFVAPTAENQLCVATLLKPFG